MSGTTSNIKISISAVDLASAALLKVNKTVAGLKEPTDRVGRSLAKFGDVSAVSRLGEGMSAFGDRTLGAARAMERLVTPMGLLTSAATIGGLAELSRRWAEAGNSVGKAANQLNVPVESMSNLRGAARIAGSSADAMDSSLKGLSQTLNAAFWGRDPAAISTLNTLHIGFQGVNGQARTAVDALGDVADQVQQLQDPRAKVRLLERLGMSPDLLPLLNKGREGLADFQKQAATTGGTMTADMVRHATEMHAAWERLELDIEGVAGRLTSKYEPRIHSVLSATSDWIEKNKGLADSVGEAGTAIMALSALKPAAWALKLLGLPAIIPSAIPSALLLPLALRGDTPDGAQPPETGIRNWLGSGGIVEQWIRSHLGFSRAGGGAAAGPRVNGLAEPAAPYSAGRIRSDIGITGDQYDVFRGGVAKIEHARYDQMGGSSGRFAGRYQMGAKEIAETARRLFEPVPDRDKFLHDPAMQERYMEAYTDAHHQQLMRESAQYRAMNPAERLQTLAYAHNQGVGGAEQWLGTGVVGRDAFGTAGTAYYDQVGKDLAALRNQDAPNGTGPAFGEQSGRVHVTVDVRHNGSAAVASADASGIATASPPRVETSLPMAR